MTHKPVPATPQEAIKQRHFRDMAEADALAAAPPSPVPDDVTGLVAEAQAFLLEETPTEQNKICLCVAEHVCIYHRSSHLVQVVADALERLSAERDRLKIELDQQTQSAWAEMSRLKNELAIARAALGGPND